jgi:hypothetical protein
MFVVFLVGLGVILSNESVSFSEFMRALGNLNPRVLSLLALPFIAVILVLWIHLRKRREERMWKKAVKKTQSKRQH